MLALAISASAAETVSSGSQGTSYSWELDSDGTLTITSTGSQISFNNGSSEFTTWRKAVTEGQTAANQDLVTKLVIGSTTTTHVLMQHSHPVFAGYPNLVSINLNKITRIDTGYYWTTTVFGNNPKLTTITCADSQKNAEGVVNIEKLSYLGETGGGYNPLTSMFSGCSSVTKIIFPETAPAGINNSSTGMHSEFKSSMLKDCSSLTELTIPSYIETINANMFEGCTALKSLTVLNSGVSLEGLTLPDNGDMTFAVSSQAQYDYVTANYSGATIEKTAVITGEEVGKYSWELWGGVLTFMANESNTSGSLMTHRDSYTAFNTWKSTYKNEVKHIVIDDAFKILEGSQYGSYPVTQGYPNLESVYMGNITTINVFNGWMTAFGSNPKLTTVWGAASSEKQENVVDISYIKEFGKGGQGAPDSDGPASMFSGCSSVKKVILPKDEPTYTESEYAFLPNNFFKNCTSLEEVVLPAYCNTIGTDAFLNCSSLKSLQIENAELNIAAVKAQIPDNVGLTIYCATQTQYNAVKASFTNAKPAGICLTGEETGKYTWSLDTLTGYLEFSTIDGAVNQSLSTSKSLTALNTWKTDYADQVKKIVVSDGFGEIYGANVAGPLNGYKNLTEIYMGSVTKVGNNYGWNGVFQGLEKLTTVWGNSVERQENVVDISFLTYYANRPNGGEYDQDSLFEGCSSITRVILPSSVPHTNNNAEVKCIGREWFKNCTSLTSIVVPSYAEKINANAFAGCTNLKTVILTNPEAVPTDATAIPATATVLCASSAQEAAVKSVSAETKTANYDALTSLGVSIRTNSHNGLRGIFAYDTYVESSLASNFDITLCEYGIITCAESKYNVFGSALTKKNGEYVTAQSSIKKIVVHDGTEIIGKVLKNSDEKDNTVDFAGTLINYKNNFKTGVYTSAYAIFKDNTGTDFITYQNIDYKKINSLYETTVTMLADAEKQPLANIEMDVAAVWNTLYQGALDLGNGAKVLSLDGNAKMMAVTLDETNYLMVAAPTKAEAEAAKTEAEAMAQELNLTTAQTVTMAVKDILTKEPTEAEPDPEPIVLSDEWLNEVKTKVKNIPEGKSFIFITDTHWSMKNKKKSPELMRYVKMLTGIDTVVFGGDMLTSEVSYNADDPNGDAIEKEYIGFWQEGVVDNFGSGSIFVMGNHDANYLRYTNENMQAGADAGKAPIDIIIDDRDIVSNSITHLMKDSYEGLDYSVTFDTDGIAAMDRILTDAGESETVRAQVEAMMKLHYAYDDHKNEIRYIVLDTGGNTYAQTQILNSAYTSLMPVNYRFLEKSLKETPAGYDVVVAAHELSEEGSFTKNSMGSYIYNIISAFKSGASTTISDATKSEYPGLDAEKQPLLYAFAQTQSGKYDFTAFTGENKFGGKIFTISGHVHDDHAYIANQTGLGKDTGGTYADVTANGTLSSTAVLAIRTAADCLPEDERENLTPPDSQLFDIVTITETGVVCTRIGLGEDRAFVY